MITLRTTVSNELLHQALFKGTFFAAIGCFILIFASVALPVKVLAPWGWAFIVLAVGLIAYGLIPYKKLSRLQLHPHKLILTEDTLTYQKKEPILTLPLISVERFEFTGDGIGVILKSPPKEPVRLFTKKIPQKKGMDLFFPHFGKTAFKHLTESDREA
jgi:hypothetical protein